MRHTFLTTFTRRLVIVFGAAFFITVFLVGTAAAHTSIDDARPLPGQEVGGSLDRVELKFFSDALDPEVVVTAPDGSDVTGQISQPEPSIVVFEFEHPVTLAGQYRVDYAATSADGDRSQSAYVFTYSTDADEVVSLLTLDDSRWSRANVGILSSGVLVIVVLIFVIRKRLRVDI